MSEFVKNVARRARQTSLLVVAAGCVIALNQPLLAAKGPAPGGGRVSGAGAGSQTASRGLAPSSPTRVLPEISRGGGGQSNIGIGDPGQANRTRPIASTRSAVPQGSVRTLPADSVGSSRRATPPIGGSYTPQASDLSRSTHPIARAPQRFDEGGHRNGQNRGRHDSFNNNRGYAFNSFDNCGTGFANPYYRPRYHFDSDCGGGLFVGLGASYYSSCSSWGSSSYFGCGDWYSTSYYWPSYARTYSYPSTAYRLVDIDPDQSAANRPTDVDSTGVDSDYHQWQRDMRDANARDAGTSLTDLQRYVAGAPELSPAPLNLAKQLKSGQGESILPDRPRVAGAAPAQTLSVQAGWAALADGRPLAAQSMFAERAETNEDQALASVGYAIASLAVSREEAAAWGLRRAFDMDPNVLSRVPNDPVVRQLASRLVSQLRAINATQPTADRLFIAEKLGLLFETSPVGTNQPAPSPVQVDGVRAP